MLTSGTITITGAYGAGNLGDEAILAGILQTLRQELPRYDLQVLSHDPAATTALHGVAAARVIPAGLRSALRIRDARETLASTKLVLIGGGGILYDSGFHDGGSNPIRTWWIRTELLRRWGVPYALLAVGAGPVRKWSSRRMLRRILEGARVVTARDDASAKLLGQVAPRTAVVRVPDPAFALAPPGPRSITGTVVCARRWGDALTTALVEGLTPLAASGERISFLPLVDNAEDDVAYAQELADALGHGSVVLPHPASPQAAIERLSHARTIVSMRLHGVILGAVAGRPTVPVSYSPKVAAVAQELHLTPLDAETLTADELQAALAKPGSPGLHAGEMGMQFRHQVRALVEGALAG